MFPAEAHGKRLPNHVLRPNLWVPVAVRTPTLGDGGVCSLTLRGVAQPPEATCSLLTKPFPASFLRSG